MGTQSDFGVFSFHGTKSLTTGEGGMLVTDNFDLFKRVKQLNNHGRSDTEHRHFWSEMVGYKYGCRIFKPRLDTPNFYDLTS